MECFRKPRLPLPPHIRPPQSHSPRARLVIPALLLALSASPSFAQTEDDSKNEVIIQIDSAVLTGNGCKKGESKVFAYHSQGPNTPIDSFLAEHDNFVIGAEDDRTRIRRICTINLKVGLPKHPDKTKSYQLGLMAVRQSGYMKILEGVTARVLTRIKMPVVGEELKATHTQEGPYDGDFTAVMSKFYDNQGKEAEYWTPCGREAPLNIATDIRLNGKSGKDRRESVLSVDGVTNDEDPTKKGKYAQDFRIKWRVCDLPQEDDGGR